MTRRKIIKCSQCSKKIFYLPPEYEMDIDVICYECGSGKKTSTGNRTASGNYSRAKKGIREDVHPEHFFRSKTEANVARIFNYLGLSWEYENRKFSFHGYTRKPWAYLMDFEITKSNALAKKIGLAEGWVEVKGYMNGASRNKLRRLKKEYLEDFNKTTVVLYRRSDKKAIEFCDKLGIKYIFYEDLKNEFFNKIESWE